MSVRPEQIVIVEDERNLRQTVQYALEREGYRVSAFGDGLSAWTELERRLPDLVLLDIIVPRMDGLELCRKVRRLSETVPVMFLTSRDDEFDRVLGLEIGADDYLCKPFSMRELMARVRVLLRRARMIVARNAAGSTEPADAPGTAVVAGGLELDAGAYTATLHGEPLALTVSEFRMLLAMAGRPGQVFSREQLLTAAYPEDVYVAERAVDSHIKRLRQKLSIAGDGRNLIDTVYGVGYRYVAD